jgi:CRP-like cAMP-binding protein
MATLTDTTGNLLLESLPPEVRDGAGLQEFDHDIRDVLIGAEETPAFVFFPHAQTVVSIVKTTASGQMVEAGVVGHEGLLSVHSLLRSSPAPTGSEAIVQNGGRVTRGDTVVVRELFSKYAPFRNAILAYTDVLLDQVTQNLLCNRLHTIEQRLAKWLLLMRDRVRKDELHLTQEFLSYMLGVHRPGVSIAMQALEADGLVRHRRNWVELRDPEGVAARSCECYRPLHGKLRTFLEAVT